MKNFDLDDVYSSDLTEDVIDLIGTHGYFSEYLKDWSSKKQLKRIVIDEKGMYFVADDLNTRYQYFLPEDKVKEVKEPKYRPFETMEEFVKTIGDIGTIITYRTKKEPSQEMRGMFTGYMWDSACRGWIIGLGANLYRLENLFELTEYKNNNSWQPFGMQE